MNNYIKMQEIKKSIVDILNQQMNQKSGIYDHMSFDGKHVDEIILYFTHPEAIQTKYELLKLVIPMCIIDIIFISLFFADIIWAFILGSIIIITGIFFAFSMFYKIYRAKKNYLYITSKRVLFHGIEWFFNDYVKKISYENIRNINFFTQSFIGKIFNYGTLEIQSSHGGTGDITVYHIKHGKMLTHYIDKLMSLEKHDRQNFQEFNPEYFKNWEN